VSAELDAAWQVVVDKWDDPAAHDMREPPAVRTEPLIEQRGPTRLLVPG